MADTKKPPGIVSPWAKKVPVPDADGPEAQEVDLQSYDNVADRPFTLDGLGYKLLIPYLPRADLDEAKIAGANFGIVLLELFKRCPSVIEKMRKQSLDRVVPLGPKVSFSFGDVTIYAKASTRDPQTAVAMAVDRLCMALTEAKSSDAVAASILKQHKIRVAVKAR